VAETLLDLARWGIPENDRERLFGIREWCVALGVKLSTLENGGQ
jgi:hypothetical protein